MSLFMVNYGRELRIEVNIRRKGKVEKATEFAERAKKVPEEAGAALKKAQKEIKKQVDKKRKKSEEWKKRDKVMLSIKDLVFKERSVRKLVDQYIGLYIIDKIVSTNTVKLRAVKLRLPTLIRIHLVVNIS